MSKWVIRGLETGIRTTSYPAHPDDSPGITPGRPVATVAGGDIGAIVNVCPTHALSAGADGVAVDARRCIHCSRCRRGAGGPVRWSQDYEWAMQGESHALAGDGLPGAFGRSLHVIVVDAGDCGACLNEVRQLNGPFYNMHRLGFFLTPSPRHADLLIVVGPVTDQMRVPLQKTYDAMPTPRRVVAVGACALSGGTFGPSFVCAAGVRTVLPVDVEVPGQPPPPLAILHGLLVAVGRRPPCKEASMPSRVATSRGGGRT